mmetsp:Transcript_99249/g.252073  ORF Transcript_99249/g.252073 Transcript_99249/m.252073 type:complete len:269 (-) Transcript_99249:708-1514(-)
MEWEHTASHQEDKLKQPTLGVLQTCRLHNTAKPSDWPHPLIVEFHHLGAAPNLPGIKRKHTQPLQRPGTRECDIGLACFENVSEVDLQKVDGHALRLVDRHRPAQTQRQLKPAELLPAGEVFDVGGPIHDDGLAVAESDHREPLGPRPLRDETLDDTPGAVDEARGSVFQQHDLRAHLELEPAREERHGVEGLVGHVHALGPLFGGLVRRLPSLAAWKRGEALGVHVVGGAVRGEEPRRLDVLVRELTSKLLQSLHAKISEVVVAHLR